MRILGRGGFSAVFEAAADGSQQSAGRPVAVKVAYTGEPLVRERFAREAEALSRIGPPHVPAMIEAGTLPSGQPFIVMERITAPTLADWLAARPEPPDHDAVVAVADAVLAGLEAAHAAGVVHRDLKPENAFIRLTPFALATLIDFGLASGRVFRSDELTASGETAGTRVYMAPEQVQGRGQCDERVDIYAFGVMLFELLTLRPPFVGSALELERQQVAMRPPRPRRFAPMSESMEALTLSCLAKDPARRPQSVAAVRAALARSAQRVESGLESLAMLTDTRPVERTRLGGKNGHQTVVLVGAVTCMSQRALTGLVADSGGFIARFRPGRCVCAFSGVDLEDPIAAAVAAARALSKSGVSQICIHIDRVLVRRKEVGNPKIYGLAVERPETWLPAGDWSGVVLTSALAGLIPESVLRDIPQASLPPGAVQHAIALVGRGAACDAIRASLTQAARDGRPRLLTIFGDAGSGKTCMLGETRRLMVATWSDPVIVELGAKRCAGQPGELIEQFLRAVGGENDGANSRAGLGPIGLNLSRALKRRAREQPVGVLIDDAHLAHDAVLDAIEHATLDGVQSPIVAVVAARPRLGSTRLRWGSRAYHGEEITLGPLQEATAMELCQQLLWPVEYPAADVLRRLVRWAGGVPAVLCDLIHTLKREGIIRQRRGKDSWYVATAALEQLPPSPARQWLTTRELAAWPQELTAFAGLCACLGVASFRDEIEWVQDCLGEADQAAKTLDTDVGIRALVDRGVLIREGDGRCVFASESFQDMAYKLVPKELCRRIHGHALTFWRDRTVDGDTQTLDRRARHAAAAGENEEAAGFYRRLAGRVAAAHRYFEAEQYFEAELSALADDDREARARALWGRSRMRCRMFRLAEALQDIAEACELVSELDTPILGAELWLERANIQDWAEDFAGSKDSVARAMAIAHDRGGAMHGDDPGFLARLRMAEGRQMFRDEHPDVCATIMAEAVKLAQDGGDDETRAIALVLWAPSLVLLGRFDDAEARFGEVIELCQRTGDKFHQCAAYANRMFLWSFTGQPDRAIADVRRATELAREAGFPLVERVATFNLAELLYWIGQDCEALELAERAKRLQERFMSERLPDDDLLLVRILLSMNRTREAGERLAELTLRGSPGPATPRAWVYYRCLSLVLAAGDQDPPDRQDSWPAVIKTARARLSGQELVEVLYWRIRTAPDPDCGLAAAIRPEVATLVQQWPIWRARFEALPRGQAHNQATCETEKTP